MKTLHKFIFENSNNMSLIKSETIDLVVTSPPYPMIEMWDEMFFSSNIDIKKEIELGNGLNAFELMHKELDKVWLEVWRALKDGGFVCINIGDATRTLNGIFSLYSNHSRILSKMLDIGFNVLPEILWRKQTNAPNKFMGSGMLPAGAYVTLEHEFILIFRKGNKREFKTENNKIDRRKSSYFWEERNMWFSDVWTDIKGTSQKLFEGKTRKRSAAFPFEIPYRLINMFSVKGDVVLDPFLGIGTTSLAAMVSCRNSIGYEIDNNLKDVIYSISDNIVSYSNDNINKRIDNHLNFVGGRILKNKHLKYINKNYSFPVVTRQEVDMIFNKLISYEINNDYIDITYE